MGGVLASFALLAVSFWLTAQVLPGVQLQRISGSLLAAALFGAVNAALGWFIVGGTPVVPIDVGYLVLFGTRWVVNGLLLALLNTSTSILILANAGTAVGAGLIITGLGTLAEYVLHGM